MNQPILQSLTLLQKTSEAALERGESLVREGDLSEMVCVTMSSGPKEGDRGEAMLFSARMVREICRQYEEEAIQLRERLVDLEEASEAVAFQEATRPPRDPEPVEEASVLNLKVKSLSLVDDGSAIVRIACSEREAMTVLSASIGGGDILFREEEL